MAEINSILNAILGFLLALLTLIINFFIAALQLVLSFAQQLVGSVQ